MLEQGLNLRSLWRHRGLILRLGRIGTCDTKRAPVLQHSVDNLGLLPALTSWPRDGGPFLTLPLVYTRHPQTGKGNLGMYRVQIHEPMLAGMHIQIHRGGGNHHHAAESRDQDLPVAIHLGGAPSLILAAVAPLPEDVCELLFASFLMGRKVRLAAHPSATSLPVLADTEFCILGSITAHERHPEGPFGDHYGYYAERHPFPVVRVHHIHCRKDPVFPATVVGRPPQEDHFITMYLQELLSPLFPVVMKGVKRVLAYEAAGVHTLTGAVVEERYAGESLTACFRILGEGQLSLTKVLLATDGDVDLHDFKGFLEYVLARCDFGTNVHIFGHTAMDTLDYTGTGLNRGSKAVFLGVGASRFGLATRRPPNISSGEIRTWEVYCPGVLVVQGPPYRRDDPSIPALLHDPDVREFRLLILVDDVQAATGSSDDFLWHVFTRFAPGQDIHAVTQIRGNHMGFQAPLVWDCRMKPGYPEPLEVDAGVRQAVDEVWPHLGLSV